MWKKIEAAPKAKDTMNRLEVAGLINIIETTIDPDDLGWCHSFTNGVVAVEGAQMLKVGNESDYYPLVEDEDNLVFIYLEYFYISEDDEIIAIAHNLHKPCEDPNKYDVEYYKLQEATN